MARRAALVATLLALACAAPAQAATGTILVKFDRPATAAATVAALGDERDGQTMSGVTVVDPGPGETLGEALDRYRARADVEYAEPNRLLRTLDLAPPDDALYASQWALGTIFALAGWSAFPGTFSAAPTAPLAIVDTGIDATHEDLAGRVSPSSSATCVGSCTAGLPTDDDGHGTHVAGIAGAATNNGLGVAGLAYASPLLAVRVFPPGAGQGAALSDVADGILWAATHGAQAINLSLGATGGDYPTTLCNAVSQAIADGAAVVAAAGNGDPPGTPVSTPTYPAACPGAVGVAATDSNDLPGSFSNYGSPDVFVSAPGVDVLSTYQGGYAYADGTSMAAPYVAALVALVRSLHPEVSVAAVRRILALSSDKVGTSPYGPDPYGTCAGCTWEQHYGYGRIDVPRALATAVPPPPPPPVSPPPPPPPPPSSGRDTTPPTVRAYAAHGRHGTTLRLRYRVRDDAGRTSERILVYRRAKVLKTFARPLRATDNAAAYWVRWRFRARGAYRFCVRATDGAGNRSRLACAAVDVR